MEIQLHLAVPAHTQSLKLRRAAKFQTISDALGQALAIMRRCVRTSQTQREISGFLLNLQQASRRFAMPLDFPLDQTPPAEWRQPAHDRPLIAVPPQIHRSRPAQQRGDDEPHWSAAKPSGVSAPLSSDASSFGHSASTGDSPTLQTQSLLDNAAASSSFRFLDERARRLISRMLQVDIPSVRVFSGRLTDKAVEDAGADAITYNDDLFFRTGMYQPNTAEGIGLIAHELTHVLQPPGPQVTERDHAYVRDVNERQALRVERETSNTVASENKPLSRDSASMTSPPGAIAPRTSPPLQVSSGKSAPAPPLAASQLRELGSDPVEPQPQSATAMSPEQWQLLKEELYDHLMDRIQTEFERGA